MQSRLRSAEQHFEQKEYGSCLVDLTLLDRQLDTADEVPLLDLVRQRVVVQIHLDAKRQKWEKVGSTLQQLAPLQLQQTPLQRSCRCWTWLRRTRTLRSGGSTSGLRSRWHPALGASCQHQLG